MQRNLCVNVHHNSTHSRAAWKQPRGLSGWEGQCNESPTPQVPAAQTLRRRMRSWGRVGVWLQTESRRETWAGEDLLTAVSLHRQKGHSSEKSHAAQDTSSLARVKGSRCLPAKQETPSLVGVAQGPQHGHEHKGPGLSPVEAGQPGNTSEVRSQEVAPAAGWCLVL